MATPAVLAQFRRIGLFEQLTDEALERVVARSTVTTRPRNSQILSVRDESNDVFFILEGRLQVKNYSEHGREFIFSEIGGGQIFGEFSALDGLPRSASVVAMEDSVIARMRAPDFLALLRSDFDLTLRLLRLLTGKARGLSDRIFELIALNARDRICFELVRLAGAGVRDGERVMIRPAPTHYEIAARIGSHREAVTRELNHLEARGYLELGRRQLVILDMTRFTNDLLPAAPA
ncbi:MAG TPA: Crp/Fnr family transcriptional regulator [Bauldia sp.]|nr:Crp/Fnr family transcriptional regulator [Bauldia sp.]